MTDPTESAEKEFQVGIVSSSPGEELGKSMPSSSGTENAPPVQPLRLRYTAPSLSPRLSCARSPIKNADDCNCVRTSFSSTTDLHDSDETTHAAEGEQRGDPEFGTFGQSPPKLPTKRLSPGGNMDDTLALLWSEDHPRGEMRGRLWLELCSVNNEHINSAGVSYEELMNKESGLESVFQRDLRRTFPNEVFVRVLNEGKLLSLFNILKAYSVFDGKLGCCQGMNYIVGLILLHVPSEKHVFWLFTRVMRLSGLRRLS